MAEAEARAPTWAEARAMQKRLCSLGKTIEEATEKNRRFLSGLNDPAQLEAKRAQGEKECLLLMREYIRLCSEIEMRAPDFSGIGEAERAAEAERLRQEAMEEARRLTEAGDIEGGQWREGEARILDFDPKQDGIYTNRCTAVDVRTFDHDEESPIGPMRLTDKVYQQNQGVDICGGLNILTVKIACSDVGYPIRVYGTVLARDSMDDRCVYLFRRDRDHCQFIKSKDKSLILSGPKRGLAVLDDNFVEIDLKIKDRQGQDRELSKGFLRIRGLAGRSLETCVVETKSLATRLSTVDVMYAVVKRAVEATIAVEVLDGDFVGTIIAHTTCLKTNLLLYHSKVAGDGHGVIRLKRPAVSVFVKEMLIIAAKTDDGKSIDRIGFTPKIKGREEGVLDVGATKMRVKVAWSIMDPLTALNPLAV